MLTQEHKRLYDQDGCVLVEQVFRPPEAATLRDHYMRLREQGGYEGDLVGADPGPNDPLKRYPRMIHMHRWDTTSLDWLVDPRLDAIMTGLLGSSPFAVQTMLYFKPPGARGQAVHQDNYYLRVQPGTCMAAWMALDDCDESNGCLQVVPGSHRWPILCTSTADTSESFTNISVPIPDDAPVRAVIMRAGDVLFFHGSLVHGSHPNTTTDRFRRALIGHYIQAEAEQVGKWYHPVLRMDGSTVELGLSVGGGRCGVWVERDGHPVVEISGLDAGPEKAVES